MLDKTDTESTKPHVPSTELGDPGGVMASFGEIVTLMAHSRRYRHAFLAELDWLVAPALANRQYSIAKTQVEGRAESMPVAAIMWACVSPAIDARLSEAGERPRLRPSEWRSGDIPWLVETVGDPRAAAILLKRLVEFRFAKTGVKTVVQSNGKYVVEVVRADTKADAKDTKAEAEKVGA